MDFTQVGAAAVFFYFLSGASDASELPVSPLPSPVAAPAVPCGATADLLLLLLLVMPIVVVC